MLQKNIKKAVAAKKKTKKKQKKTGPLYLTQRWENRRENLNGLILNVVLGLCTLLIFTKKWESVTAES